MTGGGGPPFLQEGLANNKVFTFFNGTHVDICRPDAAAASGRACDSGEDLMTAELSDERRRLLLYLQAGASS